ncbi:hypothetical protein K4K55_005821 [Colletotrichum sp. SAR 10_96]|nr:hypothetical protein K4K55_005821 [Colletotrichum sp. SAR 10_96]
MSSSLARSRSLRKPTDLSSSSTAPQRNVSPSRLPAPRPTRPTTRNVSSGSLNDTAAAAAPKKKPSALSSLLSRGSSTRQTAARKDASSTSSTTAPSSRTANAPTRTSSTREPTAGLNRLRNPAASSTSNLPGTSGSGGGSTRPTTSSGLAQKRTTPTSSTGPGLGHTRARSHYSPAKNLAPKPLTATYLAPPSPSKLPTNVALSAETSRLQTELLQLHLLHRDLPTTTSQWHASARSHLASLHAALASSSKDLVSLEADAAERLNVAALHRWATPRKGLLEERIQRLDALLTSLWSLDSPGGKHNRLVRAFERWASSLSDLEAARARADGPDSDPDALLDANLEVRFGGGLDARWKEECALLVRRLEGWDLQLKELAYDDEEEEAEDMAQTSSLKRMLDGCESLIKDMLGELAVMEEIEAAAVQRETEWIKKMNRQGDDGGKRDTPRAGAVWRVI